MLEHFKQFVLSSVCLACDGCCRFRDTQSAWRPKLGVGEQNADASGCCYSDALDTGRFLKTDTKEGVHFCQQLTHADNSCRIYPSRPFECQLYPFLLVREGSGVALGVHLACPFIQEHRYGKSFMDYVDFLHEFFRRPEVQIFLGANRIHFETYQTFRPEIEMLFSLIS